MKAYVRQTYLANLEQTIGSKTGLVFIYLLLWQSLMAQEGNSDSEFQLKINSHPQSKIGILGAPASFQVDVEGGQVLNIQWKWNGVEIPFANDPQLIIKNVQRNHEGTYQAIITDGEYSIVSESAHLYVFEQDPSFVFFETEEVDTPLAAFNSLGTVILFHFDSVQNRMNSLTLRTPEGHTVRAWFSRNGLLTRVANEYQVILFANYTKTTVDMTMVEAGSSDDRSGSILVREYPLPQHSQQFIANILNNAQLPRQRPLQEKNRFKDFVDKSLDRIKNVQDFFSPSAHLKKQLEKRGHKFEFDFNIPSIAVYGYKEAASFFIEDEALLKGVNNAIDIAESFVGCRGKNRIDCFKLVYQSAIQFGTLVQLTMQSLGEEIVIAKEELVDRDAGDDPDDRLNPQDPQDPYDSYQETEPTASLNPCPDLLEASGGSFGWSNYGSSIDLGDEILSFLKDQADECRGMKGVGFSLPTGIDIDVSVEELSGLVSLGLISDQEILNGSAKVSEVDLMINVGIIQPDDPIWIRGDRDILKKVFPYQQHPEKGWISGKTVPIEMPATIWGFNTGYGRLHVDYKQEGPVSEYQFGSFPARVTVHRGTVPLKGNTNAPSVRTTVEDLNAYFNQTPGLFSNRMGFNIQVPLPIVLQIQDEVVKGHSLDNQINVISVPKLEFPNLYWFTSLKTQGLLSEGPVYHSEFVGGSLMSDVQVPMDGAVYLHNLTIEENIQGIRPILQTEKGVVTPTGISAGDYRVRVTGRYPYMLIQRHPLAMDSEPNDVVEQAETMMRIHRGVVGFGDDQTDYAVLNVMDSLLLTTEIYADPGQITFDFLGLNEHTFSGFTDAGTLSSFGPIPVAPGKHVLHVNSKSDSQGKPFADGYQFQITRSVPFITSVLTELEPNDTKEQTNQSGNIYAGQGTYRGYLGVVHPQPKGVDRIDVLAFNIPRPGQIRLKVETFDNLSLHRIKWGNQSKNEYTWFSHPELKETNGNFEFDVPGIKGTTYLIIEKYGNFADESMNGKPEAFIHGAYEIEAAYNDDSGDVLTVGEPPSILSQTLSQSLNLGDALEMSVEAVGSNPMTFQWMFNGEIIDGANSVLFSLSEFKESHAGFYTVELSNAYGKFTSDPIVISSISNNDEPLRLFGAINILGPFEPVLDVDLDLENGVVSVPLLETSKFFKWIGDASIQSIRFESYRIVDNRAVFGFSAETQQGGGTTFGDFVIEDLGLDMIYLEQGVFRMGADQTADPNSKSDERPVRTVALTDSFWLSRFECTQAQYMAIMGSNPSLHPSLEGKAPVEFLSWEEANEFCEKLTLREQEAARLPDGYIYRLPTEAQWEYACRAGGEKVYSFGNDAVHLGDHAWFDTSKPRAVGEKLSNPWGFYDLYGNVNEWCSDWYSDVYDASETVNPKGPFSGVSRVVRGGSYKSTAFECRSAARQGVKWGTWTVGFRPALVKGSP